MSKTTNLNLINPTKTAVKKESLEPKYFQYEENTEELNKDFIHNQELQNSSKDLTKKNKTINLKPKLAIIIDDVTFQRQINEILKLGYKVTISLLPPTKNHPDSAKISQKLPFYMIHFPMQAQSFKSEEENTLHVTDSYEKIDNRVEQLKKWYPKAKYVNNHTGSKFTSDEKSMDYLFKSLKKHNLIFVDSRTTAKTLAKKYSKKYNMPYISRNIFLDNKKDFTYIQKQLKKAIKIAKKKGYAIAIGHPKDITLQVLKKSKPLLKGLDLVYIDKIPILSKP